MDGFLFWEAFRAGEHQLRIAGTLPIGFDFPAIAALARAKGCPSAAASYFFDAAEDAALAAIHDKLRDRDDG
ncbi:MAG: hypothetical protein K0S00_4064 [Xanthobacteraceae bacterium]|nr:hypothetical protein [Xanthobacteraceae bacterium]